MTIGSGVIEQNHLDTLWAVQNHGQAARLAVLRTLAEVVIPRDGAWDVAAVRREPAPRSLDHACFLCGTDHFRLYRHHVIQVQHGGSNSPRNVVSLCHGCHRDIHDWLPVPTSREIKGWSCVGKVPLPKFAEKPQRAA